MKWVRARDGMIFGVCKGLARSLDLPLGLFRLMWILSVLFLGGGVGIYLLLAVCLPREDKLNQAMDARLLGVCAKIARRTDLEVGLVRVLALCLLILSLGATFVGYLVLYFVFSDQDSKRASATKPVTPPATT